MIAAIAMGNEVLPPPPTFDPVIFVVAVLVHFILSIVLALIYAVTLARFGGTAVAASPSVLVFGLIVYLFNFHVMTGVFPWFQMARNWITIFAHLVFGLIVALMLRPAIGRVRV